MKSIAEIVGSSSLRISQVPSKPETAQESSLPISVHEQPIGELQSILHNPKQKARNAGEQEGEAPQQDAALGKQAGKTKKSVAERRDKAHAATSFEISINPPDKYTNGNVIGYTPYFTTQFGLPHRPVDGNIWERRNGAQTLRITSNSNYGIPSGSKPRLLIAWVATWQVRHPKETVIELGKNVSQFLEKELQIPRTGAYIRAVKLEMMRLFSSTISITTEEKHQAHFNHKATTLADEIDIWRNPAEKDQDALFNSHIVLTEKFRQSLLANPVPIDLRVFPILTPSPLAMDYYVWFTRVMFTLKHSRLVTWEQLHAQFGSQYDWADRRGRNDFRVESEKQIKTRVHRAYPALRVSFPADRKGIMLHPSPTPVPITTKKLFLPG